MPQGRIILKRISQSRKLSELKTDGARLLYTWLLPNLDIDGRFSGDEDVIRGQIFTRLKKTEKEVAGFLADLAHVGLIIWYDAEGDKFLQVPDFADRQPSLNPNKEAKSSIPAPTDDQIKVSACIVTPQKKKVVREKKHEVFIERWNASKRLPKIKAFSQKRIEKLNARLQEDFFQINWEIAIDKLDASDFCCGGGNTKWKADCSFLLANSDNVVKILEGKYDNPTAPARRRGNAIEEAFANG